MSQLHTYEHTSDHQVLVLENDQLAVNASPGALVRHAYYDRSLGTLVANGDDFITVLWSNGPSSSASLASQKLMDEINQEIDAEIIRVLQAQAVAR